MESRPVTVDGTKDIGALVSSSGSTGPAKSNYHVSSNMFSRLHFYRLVVALSHISLIEDCGNIGLLNAGDIHYCPGSFYWISGLYIIILGIMHGSTAVITSKKFSVDLQIRLVERYRVTFLMNSPQHVVMMLKSKAIRTADLSSIKCYFVGGNHIASTLPSEINKYLTNGKMCIGYGQTECSLLVSGTFNETVETNHAGKLVRGAVVKIVDENGSRCGIGIEGELCVKCNHPFLRYYGNEKATVEAIDNEGFIVTGDVGRFDEYGYLHIVDRLKDVFKHHNFNINPSEIESFLIQSPDIDSVCVVGVPDEMVGDLPAAAVVRSKNSSITGHQIYKMVAGKE